MPDLSQFSTVKDTLQEIKDRDEHPDRSEDRGIINKNGKSSMLVKSNGDINLAASLQSQYKLISETGQTHEVSIQSTTTTVRKKMEVDEIVINDHKLNPDLYELTDMRQLNDHSAIGNLTMYSTVLVKTWEPTLKKWVLMRRLARVPLFSPVLNLPDAPKQLDIDTNISTDIEKITKGDERPW